MEDLEMVFQEQLKRFFFSPDEMVGYLELADKTILEKKGLLETLQHEERKLQREMEKVYQLYIRDQISAEGFGRQNRPLEERRKQIEQQLPGLQGEIDFLKIQYLSSDEILSEAKDLYSRWPDLERTEKRRVIENITEKIVIGKEDITINLCYLPSPADRNMTERQRNLIPALPFCNVTLQAAKPLPASYPKQLKTIGDHLRKRRLDLNLHQYQVGEQLGVSEATVFYWESGRSNPSLPYMPTVIRFLGYNPLPESTSFQNELILFRKKHGLTQRELAKTLSLDPCTISSWERAEHTPTETLRQKTEMFLKSKT